MNENTNWLFVIVGFFSLLGFVVSLILYVSNRDKSFTPRILAAILFCIAYSLFGYLFYISKEFLRFPHLYRTPVFMSLCVAPLTYIYVRSSLEQAYRFKKWDMLFFVPAILYTAQFIPFYLLPASEKIPIIEGAIKSKSFGTRESEGLILPGLGYILRMGYSLGIIISTYVMLIRWKRSGSSDLLKINQNKEIFHWLVYLSIILSSTFFILVLGYFFQITQFLEQYKIPTLTVTLTIFFICAYLLFKPNILYGLKGWLPLQVTPEIPVTPVSEVEPITKKQSISLEQGEAYKKIIEDHFAKNLPFLKQGYAIRDLSKEVGIPSYLLSAFINQEYGKNFSEFVNENRISYLIDFTEKNPDSLLQYTLEVLGQMGGFTSRAAFIASVKRKTGKTPSEIFGK
jgi:AraC-like DNA-binding protein